MIQKYSSEIEAIQYHKSEPAELMAFVPEWKRWNAPTPDPTRTVLRILTGPAKDGVWKVCYEDIYILKSRTGELSLMSPSRFEELYRPVEEDKPLSVEEDDLSLSSPSNELVITLRGRIEDPEGKESPAVLKVTLSDKDPVFSIVSSRGKK